MTRLRAWLQAAWDDTDDPERVLLVGLLLLGVGCALLGGLAWGLAVVGAILVAVAWPRAEQAPGEPTDDVEDGG